MAAKEPEPWPELEPLQEVISTMKQMELERAYKFAMAVPILESCRFWLPKHEMGRCLTGIKLKQNHLKKQPDSLTLFNEDITIVGVILENPLEAVAIWDRL